MSRHLLVTLNSRSADLQLTLLDRADWSCAPAGRLPVPGATGPGDAAPMAMRGRLIWLAWRAAPQRILTFRADPAAARLEFLGETPVEDGLAHLSLSPDGRFLLGAGGRHGSVWRLDADGLICERTARVELGAMAHCLVTDGQDVFGTACRDDLVLRFRLDPDSGRLEPAGRTALPAGSGPRHLVLPQDGRLVHVLTQEGGEVVSLSRAAGLESVARLPLTGAASMSGEICLSPDGSALLVSERESNSLFLLPLDPGTGLPGTGDRVPVPDYPRAFHVDPAGFVVTLGFRGHQAMIHEIAANGRLIARGGFVTGERPSWVLTLGMPPAS